MTDEGRLPVTDSLEEAAFEFSTGTLEAEPVELPKVSVIMATYNCRDTIEEAVASIFRQTYRNWELVVCDDCSTDGTYEFLQGLVGQHGDRVVLLRNEANSKLAYSLNRCLAAASGDLIARMDGDDVSEPQRIERQVSFLGQHANVDLVGTAMKRFSEKGTADVLTLPASPDRFALRYGVPFAHATVMVRRVVFDVLGGYTVSRRTTRGQDYDLWFRFFHNGFVGRNLREPLYLVREDQNAVRRRTFETRVNSYRTTLFGYGLLGYPKRWYVRPTLELAKGLVPARLVMVYRAVQKARHVKGSGRGQL